MNPCPRRVRWQRAALGDMESIVVYIAPRNAAAAERLEAEIFAKVGLLADAPYLGGVCEYYPSVRFLTHGNYVIYYTVHRAEVVVRAVVHGARQFRSAWLRRDD